MAEKIVNIETARLARLPQARGEVWEVGRRRLDIAIAELERQGEHPEMQLAVQAGRAAGVIQASIVPSSTPLTALTDFILQAMRQPMLGKPRRPQLIRVEASSQAHALAGTLAAVGVRLETAAGLGTLDAIVEEMGAAVGGIAGDYRTLAARAGEPISEAGLRELFQAAKAFYRAELWLEFGDEVMFEIALQPAQGPARTLYGIVLGNLGEEFGLALYPSLDEFQRFYALSLQHLEQLEPSAAVPAAKRRGGKRRVPHDDNDMLSQLLSVSAVGLTFTPQRDVPPPLVQEAEQLRLPVARKAAFPLIMRLGTGRMEVASGNDLRDVYAALQAILAWDHQLDARANDEEIDVTVPAEVAAIDGFLPAMTVGVTLRPNPYAAAEAENIPPELHDFLSALFDAPAPPARRSALPQRSPGKGSQARAPTASSQAAAPSSQLYSLKVYLTSGLISEAYSGQEISRTIQVRGQQTLHDLHLAIFKAFDRFDEHLYEFNLGRGPNDRSRRYLSRSGWDEPAGRGREPEAIRLDALNLQVGQRFGYTFDMGDNWEHVIEVVGVEAAPARRKFPRLIEKVGASPPQYPDEEET